MLSLVHDVIKNFIIQWQKNSIVTCCETTPNFVLFPRRDSENIMGGGLCTFLGWTDSLDFIFDDVAMKCIFCVLRKS